MTFAICARLARKTHTHTHTHKRRPRRTDAVIAFNVHELARLPLLHRAEIRNQLQQLLLPLRLPRIHCVRNLCLGGARRKRTER